MAGELRPRARDRLAATRRTRSGLVDVARDCGTDVAPDRQRGSRSQEEWLEGKRVVGITLRRERARGARPAARRRSSATRGVEDVSEFEVDPRGRALHAAEDDPRRRIGRARLTRGAASPRPPPMRTLVVSDLHLGARSRRRRAARPRRCASRCSARCDGVDRLVLLGDVLELRHGPLREALAARASRSSRSSARRSAPTARSCSSPATTTTRSSRRGWSGARRDGARRRSGSSERDRRRRGVAARRGSPRWLAPGAARARLPGPVAARRRLRDARPLPRPPHRPCRRSSA